MDEKGMGEILEKVMPKWKSKTHEALYYALSNLRHKINNYEIIEGNFQINFHRNENNKCVGETIELKIKLSDNER